MAHADVVNVAEERRLLVERVSASSYFDRSPHLRDLLQYLTFRVLEDQSCRILESEIAHHVFACPPEIGMVRGQTSMVRDRLYQYFLTEGLEESTIIEIPRDSYTPVFRVRKTILPDVRPSPWLLVTLAAAAVLFAGLTLWGLALVSQRGAEASAKLAVRQFWSHIFSPNRSTDIVLDDAAVALYQELTGKPIPLSEYVDRSYLHGDSPPETGSESNDPLNPEAAETLVLRRQSSFSSSSFYWKLTQMPESAHWQTLLRFARDYSLRELRTNNSILLGNSRTNPWVQPFEGHMGIRWQYDKSANAYFPVDSGKAYRSAGYFSLALLPNLGGTGNVLIVAATGGSALNAAADFLADGTSLLALRKKLGRGSPYFEALIGTPLPREAAIVIARHLQVTAP